ncbi:MAG: tetratricopeptide repeat protein [Candidatus Hodarchaeales archaeon]
MKKVELFLIGLGVFGLIMTLGSIISNQSALLGFQGLEIFDWIVIPGLLSLGLTIGYFFIGKRFPGLAFPVRKIDNAVLDLWIPDRYEKLQSDPRVKYHHYEEMNLEDLAVPLGLGSKKWQITIFGSVVTIIILSAVLWHENLGRLEYLEWLLIAGIVLMGVAVFYVLQLMTQLINKSTDTGIATRQIEDFNSLEEIGNILFSKHAFFSYFFGALAFIIICVSGWLNGWITEGGFSYAFVFLIPLTLIALLEGKFFTMFALHQWYQMKNWDFLKGESVHPRKVISNVKRIMAFVAIITLVIGLLSIASNFFEIIMGTGDPVAEKGLLETFVTLIPGPVTIYLLLIGLGPLLTLLLKPLSYVEIYVHQGLYDKIGSTWGRDAMNKRLNEYHDVVRFPPVQPIVTSSLVMITILVLVAVGSTSIMAILSYYLPDFGQAIWIAQRASEIVFISAILPTLWSLNEERAIILFARQGKKYNRNLINETLYGEWLVHRRYREDMNEWVKQTPGKWGVPYYLKGFLYSSVAVDHQKRGRRPSNEEITEEINGYEEVIKRDLVILPKMYPDLYLNLGNAYEIINRPEAEDFLRIALKYDPKLSAAWSSLGIVYGKRNKHDESEKALRTAIKINSKDVTAWTNLGYLYFLQNRLQEAEKALRSALEIDPTHVIAKANLDRVLQKKNL